MTKKRRRKPGGPRRAERSQQRPTATARASTGRQAGSREDRSRASTASRAKSSTRSAQERPAGRDRSSAARAAAAGRQRPAGPAVIQPPVGVSLARGIGAVATSPLVVISSLLASLALWAIFAGYGVLLAATPGVMALLESLPPIHSFFLDLRLVAGGPRANGVTLALAAIGVLVIRSFLLGFWTSLLADALRGTKRPWQESLRSAIRVASARFRALFAIEGASLLLALVALFVSLGFLGAGLGQLAVLAALFGSVYFLIFTPVVAALEAGNLRWIAKASIRAARIPGPRHVLFASLYIALALFVSTLTPGSRVAAATPSIAVWSYVLFIGLIHVAVLGGLVYRWLLIREAVLADVGDESETPAQRLAGR